MKIYKYKDNVDTDVIIPARYLNSFDAKELASHAMVDIDPTFASTVEKGDIIVDTDEGPRPGTTAEGIGKLKPAFKKDGMVTAGNASGLNDGAAAMIIASGDAVKNYGLKPLAKIVCSAVVGVEPRIMGIGPVDATKLALKRAGLTLDQIDIIELNEAFAAQSIACLKELGIANDDERVNVNGGAIALGHPLGMSGCRITYSAALELQKTGKKYALATMCVGVGQGYAVILENPNA